MRASRPLLLIWMSGVVTLVLASASLRAAAPLPPVQEIVQKMIERAQSERMGEAPQSQAYYLCTKKTVTEELDPEGNVTERKVKVGESKSRPSGPADAKKWTSKNGISLNEDLLRRYQFAVWKREAINGRSAFLLTFVPKDPPPTPRRFQDYLLNRTMGTIWVDEEDYELVKADICLGKPVSFGIIGAVDSFRFSFERARSNDGNWLTRWTDTTVKARKFLSPIQTRKRVDWTGFRKLDAPSLD